MKKKHVTVFFIAFCYNNVLFRSVPGYIGRRRFVKVSLFHSSSYNRSPSPSRYGLSRYITHNFYSSKMVVHANDKTVILYEYS